MREILDAAVTLLDAIARLEADVIEASGPGSCIVNDIDVARARILGAACRAAAAEIRGALIRAERI